MPDIATRHRCTSNMPAPRPARQAANRWQTGNVFTAGTTPRSLLKKAAKYVAVPAMALMSFVPSADALVAKQSVTVMNQPFFGVGVKENGELNATNSSGYILDSENISAGVLDSYPVSGGDDAAAAGNLTYNLAGSIVTITDENNNYVTEFGINADHIGAVQVDGVNYLLGLENDGSYELIRADTQQLVKSGILPNFPIGITGADCYMAGREDGTASTDLDDLVIVVNQTSDMVPYIRGQRIDSRIESLPTSEGIFEDVAIIPDYTAGTARVFGVTNVGEMAGEVVELANVDGSHMSIYVMPTASFASEQSSVAEDAGVHSFTVCLSKPAEVDVSAECYVSASTAQGNDYIFADGTLSFAKGSDSAQCSVTLNDDVLDEGIEDIVFGLRNAHGVALENATYTLHLTDNDTTPAITSLWLAPSPAYTTDALSVSVSGEDADGDSVSYLIDVRKNGVSTGYTDFTFPSSQTSKGDTIAFYVTPTDGVNAGATQVVSTTIANAAPVARQLGVELVFPTGYRVVAQISDADGDASTYDIDAVVATPAGGGAGRSFAGPAIPLDALRDAPAYTISAVVRADDGQTVSETSLNYVYTPPAVPLRGAGLAALGVALGAMGIALTRRAA